MLVLSRSRDEEVVLYDKETKQTIRVIVADIRGDKVRLGFNADKRYEIHRREVWEAMQAEGKTTRTVRKGTGADATTHPEKSS
jgi:carbon storage regulator